MAESIKVVCRFRGGQDVSSSDIICAYIFAIHYLPVPNEILVIARAKTNGTLLQMEKLLSHLETV